MNGLAEMIVAAVLSVGVPAMVAAVWRLGSRVEVLAVKLEEASRRVEHVEARLDRIEQGGRK